MIFEMCREGEYVLKTKKPDDIYHQVFAFCMFLSRKRRGAEVYRMKTFCVRPPGLEPGTTEV